MLPRVVEFAYEAEDSPLAGSDVGGGAFHCHHLEREGGWVGGWVRREREEQFEWVEENEAVRMRYCRLGVSGWVGGRRRRRRTLRPLQATTWEAGPFIITI